MGFKIGDIVKVNRKTDFHRAIGKVGVIKYKKRNDEGVLMYALVIEGFDGHNLEGKITTGNGYWVEEFALEHCKTNNRGNY